MAKSADAFRTISEVSEWLDTPAHVLRFWESKFTQVKPVKRAGGRRYYRPSDMELLGGIKRLLHDDGMTIKGVQKLLRDKGIGHVTAMSQPLDDVTAAVRDAMDGRAQRARAETQAAEDQPASAMGGETAHAANVPASIPTMPTGGNERTTPPSSFGMAEGAAPAPAQGDVSPMQAKASAISAIPPISHPAASARASAVPSPQEVANTTDVPSLLATLLARNTPLPEVATPEVARLQGRLQIWLAQHSA